MSAYRNRKPRSKIEQQTNKLVEAETKILSLNSEIKTLKQKLKSAYEKNSIVEILRSEIASTIKPIKALPKVNIDTTNKKTYTEHLVMHLSDIHGDEVVDPVSVGGLERYDLNIAMCRAETYVDKVLKYVNNLSCYKFPVLWILVNGDMVSGEIHGAEQESYYRNMFRNSVAVGQILALMFRDLAPHFPRINIICVSGNHGRRTPKKDYPNPRSNWDYLCYEVARLTCKDLKNISWQIPNSFSANIDINGHGFHLQHGDDMPTGFGGIPWYGIQRKTSRLIALNNSQGKKIDYFVMGHFHTSTSMAHLNGETFINGAFISTDPYAYNKLSAYNVPTQLIHGVDADNGVTWRLNVNLVDKQKEKVGPSRYKIDLSD